MSFTGAILPAHRGISNFTSMASLLSVQGLTLSSRQKPIVSDFSFNIQAAEIVALTGPSGSGKSSIALAILDLLPAGISFNTGRFEWNGRSGEKLLYPEDKTSWQELRGRKIAMLQQDVFGIFDPVLKIGRQMMMILHEKSEHQLPDAESALKNRMSALGLGDTERIWNSYPHQLSGGQLQRCQLSLVTVINPDLLITDEPTSAVDKIHQIELLNVLKEMNIQFGMAVMCITHEPSVVTYLGAREIKLGQEAIHKLPIADHSTQRGDIVLSISDLGYRHRYGSLLSKRGAGISGLSFDLSEGECIGVIGQSGSGKSTLAQILVGLLRPQEGSVSVRGKKIDFHASQDIRFLRESIQLVMQDGRGALHPGKTIGELLEEVMRKDILASQKIQDILKETGLAESMLKRKPGALSGGECLRVSIARALLLQPEIIICDESTASLDADNRNAIIKLLADLKHSRSLSMIFITHDSEVIRALADQIIVFENGEIVESAPAGQVLQNPVSEVAKRIFFSDATLSSGNHP